MTTTNLLVSHSLAETKCDAGRSCALYARYGVKWIKSSLVGTELQFWRTTTLIQKPFPPFWRRYCFTEFYSIFAHLFYTKSTYPVTMVSGFGYGSNKRAYLVGHLVPCSRPLPSSGRYKGRIRGKEWVDGDRPEILHFVQDDKGEMPAGVGKAGQGDDQKSLVRRAPLHLSRARAPLCDLTAHLAIHSHNQPAGNARR